VCHYTSGPVRLDRVYFLDEYTQELAQTHGIHAFGGADFSLTNLQLWAEEVLGDFRLHSQDVFQDRKEYEMWK